MKIQIITQTFQGIIDEISAFRTNSDVLQFLSEMTGEKLCSLEEWNRWKLLHDDSLDVEIFWHTVDLK
jgi:hypothetical protein